MLSKPKRGPKAPAKCPLTGPLSPDPGERRTMRGVGGLPGPYAFLFLASIVVVREDEKCFP